MSERYCGATDIPDWGSGEREIVRVESSSTWRSAEYIRYQSVSGLDHHGRVVTAVHFSISSTEIKWEGNVMPARRFPPDLRDVLERGKRGILYERVSDGRGK